MPKPNFQTNQPLFIDWNQIRVTPPPQKQSPILQAMSTVAPGMVERGQAIADSITQRSAAPLQQSFAKQAAEQRSNPVAAALSMMPSEGSASGAFKKVHIDKAIESYKTYLIDALSKTYHGTFNPEVEKRAANYVDYLKTLKGKHTPQDMLRGADILRAKGVLKPESFAEHLDTAAADANKPLTAESPFQTIKAQDASNGKPAEDALFINVGAHNRAGQPVISYQRRLSLTGTKSLKPSAADATSISKKPIAKEGVSAQSTDTSDPFGGETVYHGSNKAISGELRPSGSVGARGENQLPGIYVSNNYDTAAYFAKKDGVQVAAPAKSTIIGNILQSENLAALKKQYPGKSLQDIADTLKSAGYDAIKFSERANGLDGNEYVVLNPKALSSSPLPKELPLPTDENSMVDYLKQKYPDGVTLYHQTSKDAAQAIQRQGFKGDNSENVYFSALKFDTARNTASDNAHVFKLMLKPEDYGQLLPDFGSYSGESDAELIAHMFKLGFEGADVTLPQDIATKLLKGANKIKGNSK